MQTVVVAALLVGVLHAPVVAIASDADRGWGYLVDKLARDGIARERAERVFRDERVDPFDGLQFSLHPRESHALYRHLRTRLTAARARGCRARWEETFAGAEREFGVPSNVVAAIIQVESGCGLNTGHNRIVPALARLAMASEPENLERNIERHRLLGGTGSPISVSQWTRWRAQVLENMFYPEVKAALEIADRMRVDPLEIRGSRSGAFGIPQFLPTSYLWYGVDGDGDGRVSLYDPADAIPSCARYLQHYGWRAELSRAERRNVIWGYNHSDAYIDTVLWLADEVESPSPEPPPVRKVKKKSGRARSAKKSSSGSRPVRRHP